MFQAGPFRSEISPARAELVTKNTNLNNFFSESEIRSIPESAFPELFSLTILLLTGGKIEHIAAGAFDRLHHLQFLYLNRNKIDHIEPGAFNNLRQLRKLYLQENNLSTLDENVLETLIRLETIRLDQNRLRCDCQMAPAVKFLQSLPNSPTLPLLRCKAPPTLIGQPLMDAVTDLFCQTEEQVPYFYYPPDDKNYLREFKPYSFGPIFIFLFFKPSLLFISASGK